MTLNLALLGVPQPTIERSWTHDDTMLYALAVGAGNTEPISELDYTTENTHGTVPKVLPSYVNVLARYGPMDFGDFDRAKLVHADQSFELERPLATSGTVHSTSVVTAFEDLGSAALIRIDTDLHDPSGVRVARTGSVLHVKGEGGFGGDRSPRIRWEPPVGIEPTSRHFVTRAEQALFYRLTGDRNPLHTDPKVAARAGFNAPILHGMCVYGFAARALIQVWSVDGLDHIAAMSGRFTAPLRPGEPIAVDVWKGGSRGWFRVRAGDRVVIDRGEARLTAKAFPCI